MNFENHNLISDEEKKSVLMEILGKLDRLFSEYNITYYLAYGTLLGAVRHQGFIPWDDDIDLLIPRKDFIRLIHFCEEHKEELKKMNLEIVEYGVNKKDYFKRFKIADTRTVMEEFGEERSAVFVDIFPLDCLPDLPTKKLRKMCRKIVLMDNLWSLCNAGVAQGSGLKKKVYAILLLLHKIFGCERMKKYYENKEISMSMVGEDRIFCYAEGAAVNSRFMKVSEWGKTIRIPFENDLFCVPENYDGILTMWYGDYMKLPPEDQRHSHEYYKMYWR